MDLKGFPKSIAVECYKKVIDIKLYLGKQSFKQRDEYYRIIEDCFAECSEKICKEDILGIQFGLKNMQHTADKNYYSLFSLLFIDYSI